MATTEQTSQLTKALLEAGAPRSSFRARVQKENGVFGASLATFSDREVEEKASGEWAEFLARRGVQVIRVEKDGRFRFSVIAVVEGRGSISLRDGRTGAQVGETTFYENEDQPTTKEER